MTNLRLLAQNKTDVATLTAAVGTTLAATLPITNLQKYSNARVARFTSFAESQINGNFPTTNIINCVVLWRQTLTAVATWRVKFYSNVNQTGTLVYDSGGVDAVQGKALDELDWGIDPLNMGATSATGHPFSILWTTEYVVRSFSITVYDPTNTSHFDITRLYMGRYISPVYNTEYGMSLTNVDNSSQFRTHGAGLWTSQVEKFRKLMLPVANLTPADRASLFEAFDFAGKTKDIFVSVFPENGGILEHDYSFAGKFVNSPETVLSSYNNYSSQFEIEEA